MTGNNTPLLDNCLYVRANKLTFGGRTYACAIGKGGFAADKREGDGCTPLGVFMLRECLYRPDRLSVPETLLPVREIKPSDGWCDDPKSTCYNKPVKHPYSFSHEQLWREDHAYDLIIPLGYNDDPVVPGKGSAIFIHIAKEQYEQTEGCVALAKADLLEILAQCDWQTRIEIRQS